MTAAIPLARPESRLSVVIPTRNEVEHLGPVLARVLAARPHEVLVVDGGSADGTADLARSMGARVLTVLPGRGRQLNAGARAATGDVLLFLHADTTPPLGFPTHVSHTLAMPGVVAGAFALGIDSPRRSLRLIERAVTWRTRFLQLPYGDQALFVRGADFAAAGGFPELPAMEDFALVRRLRRLGRIALVSEPVRTSARAWVERGVWRTTAVNQLCVVAYCLGVGPERIARWRRCGAEPRGAS